MKNRMIQVGTVIPALRPADVLFNAQEISKAIQGHADCGLLVFPELSLTGYTCADLFQQQAILEQSEYALKKIAAETKELFGLTAVIGIPVLYQNSLYSCAAFVCEGHICALIPKSYIPTYGEFYESRWFASGKDLHGLVIPFAGQNVPFGTDILVEDEKTGAVIGADICEDLWVPDKPSTHACLAGANIIVNLSASDETIGKQSYRRQMCAQQSAACWCEYLYVSAGTGESSTDLVFSGHSLICENGKVLKETVYQNTCLSAVIDLDTCSYNRMHQSTYQNDSDSTYRHVQATVQPLKQKMEITADALAQILQEEKYEIARNPFVPEDDEERGRRCRDILQIQANGLATRVRATGIKTLVLGISGGLDSTLALIAAHEAQKLIPDIRILAYTLPSKGNTSDYTYQSAMELMKAMHAEIREIPIEEGVKLHLKQLGRSSEYQGESDVTYENAQARMRTYILMDAANMENGLVVGTGDLSELALGWCTYNGDHMSMYAVNTGIPKTLVRYIVTAYADTCGQKDLHDVLHRIADTPITPELTPSKDGNIAQKTEEKIGKYDLNDFFLYYTLRYGFTPEKILAFAMCAYPDAGKEQIRTAEIRFFRRFFSQQFKRSCLPDGPKVGSVTLSPRGDWRMPSDASVSMWLKLLENA